MQACGHLPPEVKELFRTLGIDPRKEGEISQIMDNEDGTHFYGAFYHIVGKIIDGPELWVPTTKAGDVSSPHFGSHQGIKALI
ncbi:hypothetical protein ACFVAD_01460 [Sutcliffiella sp. NPDC057660]|uniref:hypothetical protein n=1 Tax=Sutcliffiella sp. NPDC057660 TaxID=3346199 RepID=UPI0036AB5C15